MRGIVPLVAVSILMAGIFNSCSYHGGPPDGSGTYVTITGPKSGAPDIQYLFTATLTENGDASVFYQWTFDDTTYQRGPIGLVSRESRKFHTIGDHIIKVKVTRTGDNANIASAVDTFPILKPHLTITPDSVFALVYSPVTYRAILNIAFPLNYTIHWLMDGVAVDRVNTDTLTYRFGTVGKHTVVASIVDTSMHLDVSGSTIFTGTPAAPLDTTSHNFKWTEMTIPTETTIHNAWVFGPNDIWCAGTYLYHYDGSSWSMVLFHAKEGNIGGLQGGTLWGLADGTFWEADGSIVEHCFPATKTAIEYRPNVYGCFIYACWGTSSNDMYFVGSKGLVLHFDGTNWTKMNSNTTKDLNSISGTSDNNIWASGYNDVGSLQTAILRYDGYSWQEDTLSQLPISQTGGFGSVYAADSSQHRVTIVSGAHVWRKTDDGSWRRDKELPNQFSQGDYDGVSVLGTGVNDMFAVGPWGFVAHWNGNSWSQYGQFFEPGDVNPYFVDRPNMNDGTICLVGDKDYLSWILVGKRQ